jgi:hypothetical protein
MTIPVFAMLIIASMAAPAQSGEGAATASFCQRLAGELGMKPAKPADGHAAWELKTLGGLGVALFGGSSYVSMGLGPAEDSVITNARQYVDACASIANGMTCTVTGPAEFQIGVKDHMVKMRANAGERAQVSMVKMRIRCENR